MVASFISPYKKHRQWGREKLKNYIEVFVNSPLEVCEIRDPKGMYKKARACEIEFFTGISDLYEEPDNPEIELETNPKTVEECASKIMRYLEDNGFV